MVKWFSQQKRDEVELTISNRTLIRVLLIVVSFWIFLLAIRQAADALILIFISIFLALALNAPVHWIAKHLPGKSRGSRKLATGVSFLLIILFLGAFIASIVPPLVRQTNHFIRAVPGLIEDARTDDNSIGRFVRRNNLGGQIDKLSDELSGRIDNIGSTALSTASWLSGSLFALLTVLVLTFMFLIEGPKWLRLFHKLIPVESRDHAQKLTLDMYKVIRGYVNGQVLLAAIAAILILVPMVILNISYPVALMVIVFICGLIPMVGHFIGATIVTLIAFFTSPWSAVIILTYYILYQQIENYIIQPNIQANTTNMSPLLVFISVLIGVNFGGLLGGLVAIPVAGCIRLLLLDYLQSRDYFKNGISLSDDNK